MTTKTKQIVAAAVLCAAASAALGQQAGVPQYGPLREPVPVPGAKAISIAGIDALKGDGMYYIYAPRVVNLRASDTPGQGNRHALTETSNDPKTSAVNGHLDVGNFVLNGERRAVGRLRARVPLRIRPLRRRALRRARVGRDRARRADRLGAPAPGTWDRVKEGDPLQLAEGGRAPARAWTSTASDRSDGTTTRATRESRARSFVAQAFA